MRFPGLSPRRVPVAIRLPISIHGAFNVPDELSLQRSKDGSVWAGHLVGIDRSISDTDLVQSPIIVVQSDYDLTRLKTDDFLNESPVLVKGYTH